MAIIDSTAGLLPGLFDIRGALERLMEYDTGNGMDMVVLRDDGF